MLTEGYDHKYQYQAVSSKEDIETLSSPSFDLSDTTAKVDRWKYLTIVIASVVILSYLWWIFSNSIEEVNTKGNQSIE